MANLITLSVSKDGAHNFIGHTHHDAGSEGQFEKRIYRTRFGTARHFVVCIEDTSAFTNELVALQFEAESE